MTDHDEVLDSTTAGGKIIRGGGLRIGSYVLGLVIGLISAPLLVRHLSVADFGLYVTVTSIIFVVGGLTEGGLANVAIRSYATSTPDERRRTLDALMGLRVVLTVSSLALAVVFTVVAGYPSTVVAGTAIAGLALIVGSWQNTAALVLQAELRLGSVAVVDLVRQLVSTAGIVGLVIAGASLLPFFIVSPVAFVATLAATLYAARGKARLRPTRDLERWKELLRETTIYAVATALGVLYFQVAIISTSLLASHEEAGFYGAAFRVVDIANGVPWLLASSAFPLLARAAHNDADRLRYATHRLLETALLVGGAFCVLIAVGAPFALQVIGGDKLDPAIPTLRLLAFGVPCTFLVATQSFTLLSLRRHRELLIANGLACVTAVVLAALLISTHGARGAAITTISLEGVLATAYAVALSRSRPELRPSPLAAVRVLVALGAGLAAGFLVPWPVVPSTIVAFAAYGVVALAVGAVPPEIAAALRERVAAR